MYFDVLRTRCIHSNTHSDNEYLLSVLLWYIISFYSLNEGTPTSHCAHAFHLLSAYHIDENYTFPFTLFYSAFHTNTKQYFATLNFRKCILKQNEIIFQINRNFLLLPGNSETLLYKNTNETHPSDRQSYTLERRYIIYSQSKRDSFKVTYIILRKSQGADCFIPSVMTMLPVDSLSSELIPGVHDNRGNYLNRLICPLIRNWLHIHPSICLSVYSSFFL